MLRGWLGDGEPLAGRGEPLMNTAPGQRLSPMATTTLSWRIDRTMSPTAPNHRAAGKRQSQPRGLSSTNAVVAETVPRARGPEDVRDDLSVTACADDENHRGALPMNSWAVAWPGWTDVATRNDAPDG